MTDAERRRADERPGHRPQPAEDRRLPARTRGPSSSRRPESGSFDAYLWAWVDGTPVRDARDTSEGIPANTPLAEAISKDLKKRGFTFVGPTIVYAYLQSTGVVNDHVPECFRSAELT